MLVFPFNEAPLDKTAIDIVGGKGMSLARLSAGSFNVPQGFFVSTKAFSEFLASSSDLVPFIKTQLALLSSSAKPSTSMDQPAAPSIEHVRRVGSSIRDKIKSTPFQKELENLIVSEWERCCQGNENSAFAVRSSGTAEDLIEFSFAGQHDTYLNVRGKTRLLDGIRSCWASLFNDRAILYRSENGFDHHAVSICVVIQRMVFPKVAGIMFTSDPVSSNRRIVAIDASYGLGEALVSGLVNSDNYKTHHTGDNLESMKKSLRIVRKKIGDKRLAIFGNDTEEGGTRTVRLDDAQAAVQVLTDAQIIELSKVGLAIQEYYKKIPQDIEWAMSESGEFFILQSRPITSLYSLPVQVNSSNFSYESMDYPKSKPLKLFFSFSHLQVMINPMKPLGLDMMDRVAPFGGMSTAGGRIYMDFTRLSRAPIINNIYPNILKIVNPLASNGMKEFIKSEQLQQRGLSKFGTFFWMLRSAPRFVRFAAPIISKIFFRIPFGKAEGNVWNSVRSQFNRNFEKWVQPMKAAKNQPAKIRIAKIADFSSKLLPRVASMIIPYAGQGLLTFGILSGLRNKGFIDAHLVDKALKGFEGNITTEMDLIIGDLADCARKHPQITNLITSGTLSRDLTLEQLYEAFLKLDGGDEFVAELKLFMTDFGMRGPSEIDITAPRFSEIPTSLIQFIAGHLKNAEDIEFGLHRQSFAIVQNEGKQAAEQLGKTKSWIPFFGRIVRKFAKVARMGMSFRETPKYFLIKGFWEVKKLIFEEADKLVECGILETKRDIEFLALGEIQSLLEEMEAKGWNGSFKADSSLVHQVYAKIEKRKADWKRFSKMRPPVLLTSDGEIIEGKHNHAKLPENSLAGEGVSSGEVIGIAKVILDPENSVLEKGEILVAPSTDPGWTPLFVNAKALVMEVGGLQTHGSVVAREMGIPAVVCVPDCTRLIKTGMKIKVNGSEGWVQIMTEEQEDGEKGSNHTSSHNDDSDESELASLLQKKTN